MQTTSLAKESHSPRFEAVLRVTGGGRKKKPHDVKSFSHELNSKGVRPFPVWRSQAVGHMEVSISRGRHFGLNSVCLGLRKL